MIKDRILWLLWLVCMAGAAVITGTWLFAAVLLLTVLILIFSAGSVVLSGKKAVIKLHLPKASERMECFHGKMYLENQSAWPVFGGAGVLRWENIFTGEKGEIPLSTREGFDMESFRYSGSRPGDDPGETYDIREYRSGDSIRQIHWKLSGKLDDIMIREKSFPVDDTVLILAEAFQADRDPQRAETVAEVFSAVLQSFMEKKISCQAGVYDHSTGKFRLEKIRTEEDRENILYRFLRYGSDAKTPVTVREYLKDPGIQNFANYVYITGDPQDKEAELLAAKGEVTIVGCGTGGRDSGGEQVLWKYGSQNPKDSQKQHMENNCPVSCWKLH